MIIASQISLVVWSRGIMSGILAYRRETFVASRFLQIFCKRSCSCMYGYTLDTLHWWLTAMTMRNFRIRDRMVLHIRKINVQI